MPPTAGCWSRRAGGGCDPIVDLRDVTALGNRNDDWIFFPCSGIVLVEAFPKLDGADTNGGVRSGIEIGFAVNLDADNRFLNGPGSTRQPFRDHEVEK